MKFSRLFYDSHVNFKSISTKWFVISIIIGLVSSLTIYSFFYVLGETFRILSYGFDGLPNILEESDRNFYNIFFAGLSILFGNSIALLFLFSRPFSPFSRLNPLRKRLLNEQIFFNFNFSYWFTKIGLVFGVFSMCCMGFDFLPYFKEFACLLLIVLYLESWKTLSRIILKKRFKLQLLHFIVLIVFTFSLSRLNVVDYQSIDNGLLKNNPIIDLPESNFFEERIDWRYPRVYFKVQLDEKGALAIYTQEKKRIQLKDIPQEITIERNSLREELINYLIVQISADKNLALKYVKMIEAELFVINQRGISYSVLNTDKLSDRFDERVIDFRISKGVLSLKDTTNIKIPFYYNIPDFAKNQIPMDTLRVSVGSVVKIKGLKISKEKLIEEFKNYINKDILFEYSYQKGATYQDYIKVISSHCKAVFELRRQNQTIFKEHRWDNHNKDYQDEQNKLKQQFPMQLIENFNPPQNPPPTH